MAAHNMHGEHHVTTFLLSKNVSTRMPSFRTSLVLGFAASDVRPPPQLKQVHTTKKAGRQ